MHPPKRRASWNLAHISHISDHAEVFLQIPLTQQQKAKRPGFNRHLIMDESSQDSFSKAWPLVMNESGDHTMGTRILIALEQIRRTSKTITLNRRKATQEA